MIFQVQMQTLTTNFFITTNPKNIINISANRALFTLCKKIFVTKFGHTVTKIWIFEISTIKFNKMQEIRRFMELFDQN